MNYYPFHIGDYIAHTAHLDPLEDCAYRRLLDAYYLNEGPLPSDIAVCARQIRMKANLVEVEQVLKEFFVLTERGWMHSRCDAEISSFKTKSEAAKTNGLKGGRPKKQPEKPKENPEVISGLANQNPDQTQQKAIQEPITNNQEPNTPQPPHEGDSRGDAEEVVDIDPSDRQPTPQGAACMAMKSVGISDVNPHHTGLLALLNAGVPLETFVATARESVARGKGSFRYVLGVVERQEREARDLVKALEAKRIAEQVTETASQRAARQRMEEVAPGAARKVPGQLSGFERAQAFMNGGDVIDVTPAVKQIGG